MEIQPHLFFAGRCEEAIAFYRETLGAVELMKLRFNDVPPDPVWPIPSEMADRILCATLAIGSTRVRMSDADCLDKPDSCAACAGASLSLTADDWSSGKQYFHALSQGGRVILPFEAVQTSGFGMLVDRFGVSWTVNMRHEAQSQ